VLSCLPSVSSYSSFSLIERQPFTRIPKTWCDFSSEEIKIIRNKKSLHLSVFRCFPSFPRFLLSSFPFLFFYIISLLSSLSFLSYLAFFSFSFTHDSSLRPLFPSLLPFAFILSLLSSLSLLSLLALLSLLRFYSILSDFIFFPFFFLFPFLSFPPFLPLPFSSFFFIFLPFRLQSVYLSSLPS